MALALTYTLDEFAHFLDSRVSALAHADLRRPLLECRILMIADMRSCFDEGRSPDGIPWAPLKNPSKKRGGVSAKPLRDKGILMASVVGGGIGHIDQVSDRGVVVGSNLDYAGVHQHGHTFSRPARMRGKGQKPWVFLSPAGSVVFTRRIKAHTQTIPARPFEGWTPRLEDRCERVFADWIEASVI